MAIPRPDLQEPTREKRLFTGTTPHSWGDVSDDVSPNSECREFQIEYGLFVSAILIKTVTPARNTSRRRPENHSLINPIRSPLSLRPHRL